MGEETVTHREAVEIETRRAGRGAMEGRVNVVGAAFRAPDTQPAPGERPLQAQRNGSLSGSGAWSGDEDAGSRCGGGHAELPRTSSGMSRERNEAITPIAMIAGAVITPSVAKLQRPSSVVSITRSDVVVAAWTATAGVSPGRPPLFRPSTMACRFAT